MHCIVYTVHNIHVELSWLNVECIISALKCTTPSDPPFSAVKQPSVEMQCLAKFQGHFTTGTARHSSSSTNSMSGRTWSLPSQLGHPGPRPTYRPSRRCSRGPLKWSLGYEALTTRRDYGNSNFYPSWIDGHNMTLFNHLRSLGYRRCECWHLV